MSENIIYVITDLSTCNIVENLPNKLTAPYQILQIKYNEYYQIILAETKLFYKKMITHQINGFDNLIEIIKLQGKTFHEKISSLYKKIIIDNPEIISTLEVIPGNQNFDKFYRYFVGGLLTIVSIFYYLKYINKNPELDHNFLFPLNYCFPNVNLQINIFNRHLYGYLKFYIENNHENTLTIKLFEQIYEFIELFGDYLNFDPEDQNENLYCLHISNLGFANYLNYFLSQQFKLISEKEKQFGLITEEKLKELNEQQTQGLVALAGKISEYNSMVETITVNYLSKMNSKLEEFNETVNSDQHKIMEQINSKIDNIIKSETQKHIIKIKDLSKKTIEEINLIGVSIGDKYVTKFNDILNTTLNKKNGTISEINAIKKELNVEISKLKEALFNNIVDISGELTELIENSKKEILNIRQEIIGENNEMTDKLLTIKTEIEELSDRMENKILDSIKINLKSIISDAIAELSGDIDVMLEIKIDTMLNNKIKDLTFEFIDK